MQRNRDTPGLGAVMRHWGDVPAAARPDMLAAALYYDHEPLLHRVRLIEILREFARRGERGFDGDRARQAFAALPETVKI